MIDVKVEVEERAVFLRAAWADAKRDAGEAEVVT